MKREFVITLIKLIHFARLKFFSPLGLVNFDFYLIISVGTLLTFCRYIGLKIPSAPPNVQIPGYATGAKPLEQARGQRYLSFVTLVVELVLL